MNDQLYAIEATKSPWWQWDTGLQVSVGADVEMRQVHFANRPNGSAYVVDVVDGLADVPDELLQVPRPIKAWGYVPQDNGGVTYVEATFAVGARNKPSGYVWTRTAQKTIDDAEKARDEAKGYATDAKASADAAAASEKLAGEHAADAEAAAGTAAADAIAAAKPTLDQYKADAKASADNAKVSETNAKSSADAAAKSAAEAKAAAGNAASEVSTSLQGYVTQAKAQADASKSSADKAAASATTAGTRADAASASASNAAEQATAAQNYASQAKSSQGAAATSAGNASTSATKAADSQSKAAASASAAAASAKEAADTVADCMKASTFGDVYGTVEPLLTTEESNVYTTTLSHDASLAVTAGLLGVDRDVLAPSLNTLTGSATDTFVHVEDAFEGGTVRGFTIKGTYSQTTTTGKNLWPQIEGKTKSGVTFAPYANRDGHADRGMVQVTGTATASYAYAGVQVTLDAGTYSFKNFGYYKGSASSLTGAVYLRVRVVPTSGSQATYNAFGSNTTSFTVSEGDSVYLDIVCGTAGDVGAGAVMPVLVKGSTMLTAWEEYTGGKASPSPDYPQEARVQSKCDVKLTGRNVLNVSFAGVEGARRISYNYQLYAALQKGATGQACSVNSINAVTNPRFTLMRRQAAAEIMIGISFTKANQCASGAILDNRQKYDSLPHDFILGYLKDYSTIITSINDFDVYDQMVSVGSSALDYRDYTEHTTPIPLPDEHPYLAALPDGTCDEIAVDARGHAVLTARVGRTKIGEFTASTGAGTSANAINKTGTYKGGVPALVATNISGYAYRSWRIFTASDNIYCYDGKTEGLANLIALFGADNPVYYALATPVTYDLGYVTMPTQPDRYLNAWVDGGDDYAIPELTLGYERDVNIVVEQLEQAVASVSSD